MLTAGEAAPDFELPDQNNDIKTMEDFIEDKLVMFFYIKDNTPG